MSVSNVGGRGFTIRDAGDAALLLELDAVIDPIVNARAIGIANAVAAARVAGVRDVVPTYRSVAVHFDPLHTDVDELRACVGRFAHEKPMAREGALIEVPVVYGGDEGPDLHEVATIAGISEHEVVSRHGAPEYRVFMLGFLPGFPYLGIVDAAIAVPRKATPRSMVPAGSVGIAGKQTGIYPRQSPGGWQVIGRTPLQLFDPSRDPAALFAPGDRVRFVAEPRTSNVQTSDSGRSKVRTPNVQPPNGRWVTVIQPGLFTTVQDSGRWGQQDRGVSVGGPMDWLAYRLANALVGNEPNAAALEATLLGPQCRFDQPTRVAVAGADLGADLDGSAIATNSVRVCGAGSMLRFRERRAGTRAYIAIDGGIDVAPALGSRATHVTSGLGGLDGRALRAGDRLPLGTATAVSSRVSTFEGEPGRGGTRLRIMRGPQDDSFDPRTIDELQRVRFIITPQSDRMGYRLRTAHATPDLHARSSSWGATSQGTMISDATFMGGLQVPPSGDPILLMADRQTTGGYPQIATVITADLPLAGQLAPGDWIEFTLCTRTEAIAALKAEDEALRVV